MAPDGLDQRTIGHACWADPRVGPDGGGGHREGVRREGPGNHRTRHGELPRKGDRRGGRPGSPVPRHRTGHPRRPPGFHQRDHPGISPPRPFPRSSMSRPRAPRPAARAVSSRMAADVAAMAPTTASARPIPSTWAGGEKQDDTMKQKLENFSASYIESIAVKQKRNADWARRRCAKARRSPPKRRWQLNVIDLIANDRDRSAEKLDGREVNDRKLKTARRR